MQQFQGLTRSLTLSTPAAEHSFATRADYAGHLVEAGVISGDEDLASDANAAIVVDIYRHWQLDGQIACEFARELVRQSVGAGLRERVLVGPPEGGGIQALARAASAAALEAIAAEGCEGLSLIFPSVTTPESVVLLCHELAELDEWVLDVRINPSDRYDRVYVGLRVFVSEDPPVVSEALGFGNFEFLPVTRRGPFTSLELRSKVGRPNDPKKDPFHSDRPGRVHLANIRTVAFQDFQRTADQTERARLDLLGGDDSAAKAKVTYAIPRSVWEGS